MSGPTMRPFVAFSTTHIEAGTLASNGSFTITDRRKLGAFMREPELHESGWDDYLAEVRARPHGRLFFQNERVRVSLGINRDNTSAVADATIVSVSVWTAQVRLDDGTLKRVELGNILRHIEE